jgi:HK97 gp10 family phage protein
MSFNLSLKIAGVKEAADALSQFSDNVLQGTSVLLEQIGNDMVDEMQATCPVSTGNLQSLISSEMDGTDLNVVSDAEYSGFVEFGTWKTEPQPYFGPAVDKVRGGAGLEDAGADALAEFRRAASSVQAPR